MALSSALPRSLPGRLLLVVVASAAVAIATTDTGLFIPPVSLPTGFGWLVRLGGALAAAAGCAALVYQRRRTGAPWPARTDPTAAAVATAATIMVVLSVLALATSGLGILDPIDQAGDDPEQESSAAEDASRNDSFPRPAERGRSMGYPATGEGGGRRGGQGFGLGGAPPDAAIQGAERDLRTQLLWLGALLAAVAIVGLVVVRRRLAGARQAPGDGALSAAEAAAGLEASLEEVAYPGGDPRSQITAAYHRLLVALADAGAPRQSQEAPHEHLRRTLVPLGVARAPMHRLAELYVIAQFSTRALTEAHRRSAAHALEEGLASLSARSLAAKPAGSGEGL